jgi:hypothetical protein
VLKTHVYVDGFNLYYGAVRRTPWRWLDIHKLCSLLLPRNRIERIRYFTALVQNSRSDPTKAQRQQALVRALETLPNLSVHYGRSCRVMCGCLLSSRPRRGVAPTL